MNRFCSFFLYSPLEQFALYYSGFWTNFMTSFLIIQIIFSFFFLSIFMSKTLILTNRLACIFEEIYMFALQTLKDQAGSTAKRFLPIFLTTFFFVLLSNLQGIVPFGYTITAQIFVTFFISFALNFGLLVLGFYLHGLKFLNFFVPKDVEKFLLPLLVIIEVISYFIRSFSLSLRLFANMIAGHILLAITLSSFYFFTSISFFLFFFGSFFSFFIIILEFAIAFLQSYVFLVLFSIYLNDAITGGH
jgi:F-type H+-transporting ATPase subunit a